MENLCQEIIKKFKNKNQTISFMESCTGGFLANQITNIEGASDVLKISLITYSNEYKIKFGVDKETIDKYTVYSTETAEEMAKQISFFANSNYGIGITGEIAINSNNKVFYAIYDSEKNEMFSNYILVHGITREEKKLYIANYIFRKLLEHINKNKI